MLNQVTTNCIPISKVKAGALGKGNFLVEQDGCQGRAKGDSHNQIKSFIFDKVRFRDAQEDEQRDINQHSNDQRAIRLSHPWKKGCSNLITVIGGPFKIQTICEEPYVGEQKGWQHYVVFELTKLPRLAH